MPRFYFHLYDDLDVPDLEGIELPNLAAARKLAEANAMDLMCGVLKATRTITLHHRIEIEDEQHQTLETVLFSELVTVEN